MLRVALLTVPRLGFQNEAVLRQHQATESLGTIGRCTLKEKPTKRAMLQFPTAQQNPSSLASQLGKGE